MHLQTLNCPSLRNHFGFQSLELRQRMEHHGNSLERGFCLVQPIKEWIKALGHRLGDLGANGLTYAFVVL